VATPRHVPPPRQAEDAVTNKSDAELLAVLPRVDRGDRVALPVDLFAAWAPALIMMHRAFEDWKVKLRPMGSDPFAEAMLRDLKDEYLRLERVQTQILSTWTATVIAVAEQKAYEYVERLWYAKMMAEADRGPPPVLSRAAAAEAARLSAEVDGDD
jgi:hypothetical protein